MSDDTSVTWDERVGEAPMELRPELKQAVGSFRDVSVGCLGLMADGWEDAAGTPPEEVAKQATRTRLTLEVVFPCPRGNAGYYVCVGNIGRDGGGEMWMVGERRFEVRGSSGFEKSRAWSGAEGK